MPSKSLNGIVSGLDSSPNSDGLSGAPKVVGRTWHHSGTDCPKGSPTPSTVLLDKWSPGCTASKLHPQSLRLTSAPGDLAETQILSQQVWGCGLSSQVALLPLVVLMPACTFESPWDHFRNTSAWVAAPGSLVKKCPHGLHSNHTMWASSRAADKVSAAERETGRLAAVREQK